MTVPTVRRLPLVVGAVVGGVVVGIATLAGAAGLVDLSPAAGPAGTGYEVTVACSQEPTLTGRPLVPEGPPGTVPPVSVVDEGQGVWTYQATAGEWDDQWGAVCGDEVEVARFDTDAPRLFLGPVPGTPFPLPGGRTTLEGSDCPAGSTVTGSFLVEGDMLIPFDATPGERGDWSTPIPSTALGREFVANATCETVTYDPYAADPVETDTDGRTDPPVTGSVPTAPAPTTPTPNGPVPMVPPAVAPLPLPGRPSYTG